METHKFITKYFPDWTICSTLHCGHDCGSMVLRMRGTEVRIKVFFNLNGGDYWTHPLCTVDHVEGIDMLEI